MNQPLLWCGSLLKKLRYMARVLYGSYTKRTILVIGTFFMIPLCASAQYKSELSVFVQGPISQFSFEGKSNLNNGVGAGLIYAYSVTPHISLMSGVEYQRYSGSIQQRDLRGSYETVDVEGEDFVFNFYMDGFEEKMTATYLNVPVVIKYESLGLRRRFYAAAGIKVGFNMVGTSHITSSSLRTSGYYGSYNVELSAPRFMGFGDFSNHDFTKKNLELGAQMLLTLETGIKILSKGRHRFYLGVFADVGLTDINNIEENSLLYYNAQEPTDFIVNSLFNSRNSQDNESYLGDVKFLAFGFKVRYGLGI